MSCSTILRNKFELNSKLDSTFKKLSLDTVPVELFWVVNQLEIVYRIHLLRCYELGIFAIFKGSQKGLKRVSNKRGSEMTSVSSDRKCRALISI